MQGPWPPKIQPFSPEQAKAAKQFSLPTEVIEAVNQLLAAKVQLEGTARFDQDEVVDRVLSLMNPDGDSILDARIRNDIFSKNWLDFEPVYEARGWDVKFDKAVAWGGENYTSFWVFTPKKS